MRTPSPLLDPAIDTIAELRELYRAAEARAARLRLLSASGRELAEAGGDRIEAVLDQVAARLAYFLGRAQAAIALDPAAPGIAIRAPGDEAQVLARIHIDGLAALEEIGDSEDRDAVRMHIEMIGATIDRINRDRERADLLAALREREQRLEYLVGRLFSAQEEERRRVSHELHDGVAQTATALVRLLEGGRSTPADDIPAAERARLAAIGRDLVRELRAVIGGLRPTMLDDLGLEAAFRSLADALAGDGFAVTVEVEPGHTAWPPHVETALFRIGQEAVSNIRKHARPGCRVELELRGGQGSRAGHLRIEDFGDGPAPVATGAGTAFGGAHIGIDVMRERMAAVGGSLHWEAKPGGGVMVIASIAGQS